MRRRWCLFCVYSCLFATNESMASTIDNWQVWQDAQVAAHFAADRRGGFLGAEQQFDTLLRLVAYVPQRPLAVLDLGCGDGIVLDAVLRAYPVSRAVAVDGSPAMLERAAARFQGRDEVTC